MRRIGRWSALWIVAAAGVLVGATPAEAQRLGGQRWSPAGSQDGILGTEGAERRRAMDTYVSLWLHYALDPIVVLDDAGNEAGSLVRHLLGADVVGSIHFGHGVEVGLLAPVTLFHTGQDAAALQAGMPGPHGAGFGDLQVRLAYRIPLSWRAGLAVHVPLLLPTSRSDDVLSLGLGVRPTVAFQYGLDRADLVVNASYLLRERIDLLDYQGGQELGLRLAARVGLDEKWDTGLLAELGFSTATRSFFDAATSPAEARVGIEHWLGPRYRNDVLRWRLTAFLGTGLTRGVGAPDFRAGVGIALGFKPYRPRLQSKPGDRDGDGIPDDEDQCPDDPEDFDGFEDEDGCPDYDRDGDGIPDHLDRCPDEPETIDGFQDDDGCPDKVRVEGSLITTFETVQFRTGSDDILPASHGMLREVVGVLQAHPDMHIRIEGHTDSVGDEQVNLDLSQRRAESVRRFLIGEGIDGKRLEAVGHGESRPIADNATAEGRKKNRRVEFHIADR
jgi:large repetitive protein